MKKGVIAYVIGLLISFIFGMGFMGLHNHHQVKNVHVYYLQTGVYQTHDNALNMLSQVQGVNLDTYIYQKGEHYYVICAITTKIDEIEASESVLSQQGLNYVRKEIDVENAKNNEELIKKMLEVLAT